MKMNISVSEILFVALLSASHMTFAAETFEFGIEQARIRAEAPTFSLSDLNGSTKQLSDYTGKVVLLSFWATWCGPCRKEMPGMQRLWQRYKDQGLVVVAVSVDKGSLKRVLSFVKRHVLTYPVLLDPTGEVQNRYEVVGLPMSYIIGRDGKISARIIGTKVWDGAEAYEYLERIL